MTYAQLVCPCPTKIELHVYSEFFFSECGGNYSDASGHIYSPAYPEKYPHGRNCTYLITQPFGSYINMTIIDMDIDCNIIESDNLEIRDGHSGKSPKIAEVCGNGSNIPSFMVTSQNSLRIR